MKKADAEARSVAAPRKEESWALQHLSYKHEWVFILDADEVLPAGAESEIRGIVTAEVGVAVSPFDEHHTTPRGTHEIVGYWVSVRRSSP